MKQEIIIERHKGENAATCDDPEKLIEFIFCENQRIESMARGLCTGRTISGHYITDQMNKMCIENMVYAYMYEDTLSITTWVDEIIDIGVHSLRNIVRNNNESIVMAATIISNIQNIIFDNFGDFVSVQYLMHQFSKALSFMDRDKQIIVSKLVYKFVKPVELQPTNADEE